jgi:hypothetical protein
LAVSFFNRRGRKEELTAEVANIFSQRTWRFLGVLSGFIFNRRGRKEELSAEVANIFFHSELSVSLASWRFPFLTAEVAKKN